MQTIDIILLLYFQNGIHRTKVNFPIITRFLLVFYQSYRHNNKICPNRKKYKKIC